MGKKDKAGDNSPAELLDIRDVPYEQQVKLLYEQYRKAYEVWSSYPEGMVDPRLVETFKVAAQVFKAYISQFEDVP